MKGKVAVATVHGKVYYLVVNALAQNGISFYSLIPGQHVPTRAKLVITTEEEKAKVDYSKILVFRDESELETMILEVKKTLLGKEVCDKIVIGIDPGEAIGLAVLADGKLIEEGNFYNSHELVNAILKIIRTVNFSVTKVWIKIGNGVPVYKELLHDLDEVLPAKVNLEVVVEAGTNRPMTAHSRKVRHISSAIRIAARTGQLIARRKPVAENNTHE
jgi:hypothetical protein